MAARPRLLYISPVVPMLTGNGLAMRAGIVLEALAHLYDVDLLVAPLYPPFLAAVPEPFAKLCHRAAIVPTRPQPPRQWADSRFDVVHVFRLSMLPFSRPYLSGWWRRPQRHLDLDDIESVTRRRLAALYRQNGDAAAADREAAAALRQEALEAETLRTFHRVYVCSAGDGRVLETRGHARAQLRVLPNAVRLPAPVPAPPADGVFTFLFVGTLGYYPNEDAVRLLCAEIVPRLRKFAPGRFAVHIAGTGAAKSLIEAANVPQVRFLGEVPNLDPYYAQAHAVLAPIRAGGGTRIKVLEAFSYGRPVVATNIAMEGIEARPEEHVLIGDTPEVLAQQCARLVFDRALGQRLAGNALALLRQRYTVEALAAALGDIGGR